MMIRSTHTLPIISSHPLFQDNSLRFVRSFLTAVLFAPG